LTSLDLLLRGYYVIKTIAWSPELDIFKDLEELELYDYTHDKLHGFTHVLGIAPKLRRLCFSSALACSLIDLSRSPDLQSLIFIKSKPKVDLDFSTFQDIQNLCIGTNFGTEVIWAII